MGYIGLVPNRGAPRPPAAAPPGRRGGERKVLLMHGTTLPRAQAIIEHQGMAPQRSFFTLGLRNRDIARLFALRASQRSPRAGPPALVFTALPETAFERLRRLGLMRALPFDPEDRPELRNRRQWVLEPGGVEILNREAESWRMVPLGPRR
jgi:hypothetical protein